jgi:hypothetical protein
LDGDPTTSYAGAPDGRRFYTTRVLPRESAPITHINVIFNWFEEVKAKVK